MILRSPSIRSLIRAETASRAVPRLLARPFSATAKAGEPGYWNDDDLDKKPPRPGSKDMKGFTAVGQVTEGALKAWDRRFGKKRIFKFSRSSYPPIKRYQRQKMKEMFEASDNIFFLCFQHNMTVKDINSFDAKIREQTGGRVVFKSIIRNALCRVVVDNDFDGRYSSLSPIFHGPTSVVYGTCSENMFADMRTTLNLGKDVVMMGGLVNGVVVDHEQLEAVKGIESLVHLRSELIQSLQQPVHNLVRTLKFPTNGLVKVLDFKAKPADSEASSEAEAEAN